VNCSPPNESQSTPLTNAAQFVHASQQGIADVFNKKICDAIKGDTIEHNGTTYLRGAITMSFPMWVMYDCIMTLAIHESKVEYFAKVLFNIQVVSRRHVRSLIFPGGVEVAPSPELTVKGVSDAAIMDVFGPEI
jgi:hypothetical protein